MLHIYYDLLVLFFQLLPVSFLILQATKYFFKKQDERQAKRQARLEASLRAKKRNRLNDGTFATKKIRIIPCGNGEDFIIMNAYGYQSKIKK